MTATRIARAGRSRFFIGLGVLVLTMGFVAMFHSSQQQLDESRRMEIRCEQQQEALSSQIELLENTLKTERYERQQFKQNLEREAREQTELKEKAVQETNLKFSTLQQHYKLLKSEHDDYTDECTKTKAKQMEELNALQGKVKSLQNQVEQSGKEKDKEIELWKAKYNQLLSEKQLQQGDVNKLAELEQLGPLKQEIEDYKAHCSWRPSKASIESKVAEEAASKTIASKTTKQTIEKNFNAQIPVSENLYEIPIKLSNHTTVESNTKSPTATASFNGDGSNTKTNNNNKNQNSQIRSKSETKSIRSKSDAIINSVENFQLVAKPIVESPQFAGPQTSTTATSNRRKTSESSDDTKLNMAPNAPMPEQLRASSTTAASKKVDENRFGSDTNHKHPKPVPNGVVPFQTNLDDISIKALDKNGRNAVDQLEQQQPENNRYVNVVDEVVGDTNAADSLKDKLSELQNVNDNDNAAHEVNDNNDFVMDEHNHRDHILHKSGIINNAAEEDMNLYDSNKFKLPKPNANANDGNNGSDDDLQVIHRGGDDDARLLNQNGNKLMNEIAGDQGKVVYPDDVHMEEQVEDEDDDEYSNPARNKPDPAVRHR